VLRGLGWELLRVWSTDWFDNPDSQTERLVKRLKEMRARPIAASQDYRLKAAYASRPGDTGVNEPARDGASGAEPEKRDPEGLVAPVAPPAPLTAAMDRFLAANGSGPITEADLFATLATFRETVIRPAASSWQPHRSILRDSMIETFLRQRITDPEDWFNRVPHYLRSGTDPVEKRMYLDQICAIVEGIA
jgi:hypothetical protein